MSNDGNKQASYWEERALIGGRGSGSVGGESYASETTVESAKRNVKRLQKRGWGKKSATPEQAKKLKDAKARAKDLGAGRKAGVKARGKQRKEQKEGTVARNLARKALGARPQKKTVEAYKGAIRNRKRRLARAGSKPKSK